MRKHHIYLSFLLLALAQGQGGQVVGVYTLPPTSIRVLNPHLSQAEVEASLRNGWPTADRPALGSSLAYLGNGLFVGSTDRGPNGDCPGGKFFPLSRFAPSLVFFRLEGSALRIERSLPLQNLGGRLISGLPNARGEDVPYANKECRETLPLDPDGLDVEDVAVTPSGWFWMVEENSPSLIYATPQGRIAMRYLPQGLRLETSYPSRDILPSILRQRRNNRGLENLALSGDGRTAWVILQSPIGRTSDPAFDQSLVARAVRLDVSNPMQAQVTGMYLVPFSDPKDYPKPNRPRDMKYSAATWLKDEQILLLERAEGGARVFLVDFARATNLLERPDGNSPELDKAGVNYAALNISLPQRRLLLETWKLREFDTDKLEGLALLEDGQTLAIIDDNDFAITGKEGPTRLWLVRLNQKLR